MSSVAQPQTAETGWTAFGPPGRVTALAVHPLDPQTLLVGTPFTGIFRTTDLGAHWSYAGEGLSVGEEADAYTIRSIRYDPVDPTIVFAAAFGDGVSGAYVYRSTDEGIHWVPLTESLGTWGFGATSLFGSTDRMFAAGSAGRGVYRSTNGGGVWSRVLNGSYSGGWLVEDSVWIFDGLGQIAESTDGGSTWSIFATNLDDLAGGLFGGFVPRTLVLPDRSIVMCSYWYGGVSRSFDRRTWTARNEGLPVGSNQYTYDIAWDPDHSALFTAFGDSGIYRSTDLGAHWTRSAFLPGVMTLASGHGRIFAGTEAGVYASSDGGEHWATISRSLPTGFVNAVAASDIDTQLVLAATMHGVFESTDGGASWSLLHQLPIGLNVNAVAISPVDPRIRFVGYGGLYEDFHHGVFRTTDGGSTWTDVSPEPRGAIPVTAIALHPTDTSVVFMGSPGALWKSTDGGSSWKVMTSREGASETEAIAISPSHPEILWMGAWSNGDDGVRCGSYLSEDGGTSWTLRRTTEFGVGSAGIMSMAIHRQDPDHVIAGTFDGGIQHSHDRGLNWEFAHRHLGQVRRVEFDPIVPDRAYAVAARMGDGTNRGIYRSDDQGRTWDRAILFPAHQNILKTLTTAVIQGRVVTYVGTFGAGVMSDRSKVLDPPSHVRADEPLHATSATLEQPYPSPFNGSATIRFVLPEAQFIRLRVFDAVGRAIAELRNGLHPAGEHVVTWEAGSLPSGVYFCRLVSEGGAQSRSLILIR